MLSGAWTTVYTHKLSHGEDLATLSLSVAMCVLLIIVKLFKIISTFHSSDDRSFANIYWEHTRHTYMRERNNKKQLVGNSMLDIIISTSIVVHISQNHNPGSAGC